MRTIPIPADRVVRTFEPSPSLYRDGQCLACGNSGWIDGHGYPWRMNQMIPSSRLVHSRECPMNDVLEDNGALRDAPKVPLNLPFHIPRKGKLILTELFEAGGEPLTIASLRRACQAKSEEAAKVHISELRGRLLPHGMSIEAAPLIGYWLGPITLEKLKGMLPVPGSEKVIPHSPNLGGKPRGFRREQGKGI